MKTNKNMLDERQEAELLKIERNGCWFAFWALLAAILIQQIMGRSWEQLAGEWIIFMVLAVYITAACLRRGIWSRNYRMDAKTNAAFSALGALAFAGVVFVTAYFRKPEAVRTCLMAAGITFVVLFVILMVSLSLAARATQKRREDLDREPEDTDV